MELTILENNTVASKYDFIGQLENSSISLTPISIDTLQINTGKLCNQACRHCHVDASPTRTEMMKKDVFDKILEVLYLHPQITKLDITGGAPELNEHFNWLVIEAKKLGKHIMVRHNLTVQFDGNPVTGESKSYLPEFFAEYNCEVICSLPYYSEYFTDKQRGKGVFNKSIEGIIRLNKVGYGTDKILNLVYNPVGPFLPADQSQLESDFKRELDKNFGIRFNNLFTITNMPIHRFREDLLRTGGYEEYMNKLVNAFNPTAANGVMCRSLINVNYDGTLSDCDFNQMLDMPLEKMHPKTFLILILIT